MDDKVVSLLAKMDEDPDWAASFIVTDFRYWVDNEREIRRWLTDSGMEYRLSGMVLMLRHAEDKAAFLLRWA